MKFECIRIGITSWSAVFSGWSAKARVTYYNADELRGLECC
jgi:hypothetical protein